MAWLPFSLETDVCDTRIDVLSRQLGIERAHGLGLYFRFLIWMQHFAISGDASLHAPEIVAAGADWKGDPMRFIDALKTAQILDLFGVVCDWQKRIEYYSLHLLAQEAKLDKRRAAAAGRQRTKRDKDSISEMTLAIMQGKANTASTAGTVVTDRTAGTEVTDRTEVTAGTARTEVTAVTAGTETQPLENNVFIENVSRTKERPKDQKTDRQIKPTSPSANLSTTVNAESCAEIVRKTEVGFSSKELESMTWRAMRAVLIKLGLPAAGVENVINSMKARCGTGQPKRNQILHPIGNLLYANERNRDTAKPPIRDPITYILKCSSPPDDVMIQAAERLMEQAYEEIRVA